MWNDSLRFYSHLNAESARALISGEKIVSDDGYLSEQSVQLRPGQFAEIFPSAQPVARHPEHHFLYVFRKRILPSFQKGPGPGGF